MTIDDTKPLAVALSGPHLVALLEDAELTARLDAAPLAFAIAGIDRVDGDATPDGPTVESTIAAATLSARARRLGWLAAAAVHRDHPYNLARRVASLDHVAEGRAGVLLGISDNYAPVDGFEHGAWGGAGLTDGVPLGVATTADVAAVLRALWRSWPAESIVADRDARVYARAEQVVHVDHHGVFDVEGPLTVPSTAQGAPVLAWRATTAEEAEVAAGVADLLVWPGALADAPRGAAVLYAEVAPADAAAALADDRVAGVVLRPAPTRAALVALLDGLAATAVSPTGGTLRDRLGLPAAAAAPADARPAFASINP